MDWNVYLFRVGYRSYPNPEKVEIFRAFQNQISERQVLTFWKTQTPFIEIILLQTVISLSLIKSQFLKFLRHFLAENWLILTFRHEWSIAMGFSSEGGNF